MAFSTLRPDPRFLDEDITYLSTDGTRKLGRRLYYFGNIAYALILTADGCYFTREGLASIYTSRHRAIVRHFL